MFEKFIMIKNKPLLFSNSLFFFIACFLLINNQNAKFPIHDFLDGVVPIFKYLSESKIWLSGLTLERYMYGIESGLIGYPQFSPEIWLHKILPSTSLALLVSEIFIRYIGFIGFLSLTKHFQFINHFLSTMYALVFAFLPVYPSVIYSVMVQPLMISIIIKILQSRIKMIDFLGSFLIGIVLVPTYSMALFFLLSLLILAAIFRFVKFSKRSILVISILFVCHIISFLPTYILIFEKTQSHREEFKNVFNLNLYSKISKYAEIFLFGDYHFGTNFYLFIPILILQFLSFNKNINTFRIVKIRKILFLIIFIIFVIFVIGSELYETLIRIVPLNQDLRYVISILPILTVTYSYLSSILLYQSLKSMALKYLIMIPPSLISILGFYLFPWYQSFPFTQFQSIKSVSTIDNYFSYKLFEKKNLVTSSGQKLMSYGLDPMIALFNEQYIADGYASIYKLDYKKDFRLIIQENLENDVFYKNNFDNWGSRLYLIGNYSTLNFCASQKLNVEYVVSNQLLVDKRLILIQNLDRLFLYRLNC
jgi:hypothetical protein